LIAGQIIKSLTAGKGKRQMENNYWTKTLTQRLSRRRAMVVTGGSALAAAFLAACGGSDSSSSAVKDTSGLTYKPEDETKKGTKGGVMQGAYAVEQLHFDPLSTNSQFTFGHAGHAYQKLLSLKPGTFEDAPTGEVDGEVASAWEISPDGMQLTMKLRPGNKWDQRPPTSSRVINSDDVRWSWNRYLELSPGRTAVSNAHHPASSCRWRRTASSIRARICAAAAPGCSPSTSPALVGSTAATPTGTGPPNAPSSMASTTR
jgi:hypothetical protein